MLGVFAEKKSIESWEYGEIAKNIVSGNGYSLNYRGTTYRSIMPPAYPILIAGIYKITGNNKMAAIYFQIVLSCLTCIIIFLIARRISNSTVANVAAFLFAFHPGLIIYSTKNIHTLNLDILLFLSVILFTMKLKESPSFKNALLLGSVFGITLLSRPTIMILPVVILWLFIFLKERFSKKVILTLIIISTMAIPISGWVIRNYVVLKSNYASYDGKPILCTSDTYVLWLGNNPNATGTAVIKDGTAIVINDKELMNKLSILHELEQRELFKTEAIDFIKNNPAKFIKLYIKKLYYFWWFSPVSGILYPSYCLLLYKIYYVSILSFALIGLVHLLSEKDHRMRSNTCLAFFFMIAISLFQAIYYVEGRHRWGVEPILMIFSAAGIVFLATSTIEAIAVRKKRHETYFRKVKYL